jgi:uncharacterized membrane protein AbrB (regulator of aidB expression)
MSAGDMRKGITQAKFNDEASNLLYFEIAVLAIAGGLYFESWYIGVGVLLGLIIAFQVRALNLILAVLFSLCWSIVGAAIANLFSGGLGNVDDLGWHQIIFAIYSTPAAQVVGGLLFLSILGIHLAGIEFQRDLVDTEDRNI